MSYSITKYYEFSLYFTGTSRITNETQIQDQVFDIINSMATCIDLKSMAFGLLLLLCLLVLSYLAAISAGQHTALAHSLVQIVKHRDLVIDLGRVE